LVFTYLLHPYYPNFVNSLVDSPRTLSSCLSREIPLPVTNLWQLLVRVIEIQ